MIKTILFSLLLFFHSVSAQAISDDESIEHLISGDNPSTSQTMGYGDSSYLVKRTSGLNGKIELGGLMFLKASASVLLEFEQPIFDSNLIWLFQGGGGAFVSHGTSNQVNELAGIFKPYASVHTGLRYQFDSGFTASLALGIRTFEIALWGLTSLGWNIGNKVHIEMGLATLTIFPIALTFSVSVPLIK